MSKGADPNCRNLHLDTPLHCAAYGTFLYQQEAEQEKTNAIPKVLTPIKILLQHQGDIRSRSGFGATGVHLAAWRGHRSAAAMLLEAGAGVNAPDHSGMTPLHLAAGTGDVEMVKWLLTQGADTSLEDRSRAKPADVAAKNGFPEIAKLLRLTPEARNR